MSDSPAAATILENGIRAGDRSGLTLLRPPPPGAKRFRKRGAERIAPKPKRQSYAWFWDEVAPQAAAASPARWDEARAVLRGRRDAHGPVYSEPRLARLWRDWGSKIAAAARESRLSEALVLAVVAVESAGNPKARSHKGALGLMQLIPATAKRFGVADAFDPDQNLAGGSAYLDFLLERFDGDIVLALAGYNAGENAVDKHGGVPPYAETRDYVVKVLDALIAAEALCAAPPRDPRARCEEAGRAGL